MASITITDLSEAIDIGHKELKSIIGGAARPSDYTKLAIQSRIRDIDDYLSEQGAEPADESFAWADVINS